VTERILHSYLPLAYVAAVTAGLLALVAEQASRGPHAFPGVLVCAFAAGFGLEFVSSGWAKRRRPERC
jgi:hypothetical protein